jgi:hypothetical protein
MSNTRSCSLPIASETKTYSAATVAIRRTVLMCVGAVSEGQHTLSSARQTEPTANEPSPPASSCTGGLEPLHVGVRNLISRRPLRIRSDLYACTLTESNETLASVRNRGTTCCAEYPVHRGEQERVSRALPTMACNFVP